MFFLRTYRPFFFSFFPNPICSLHIKFLVFFFSIKLFTITHMKFLLKMLILSKIYIKLKNKLAKCAQFHIRYFFKCGTFVYIVQ